MLRKKNILNVGVTDASKEEILEYIVKGLVQNGKKYFIVTPNPEILVMASKNIDYQKVLNRAEIALADGIGVIIAGQILGKPLKERITGVDLLESLCLRVAEKPITVGFLGGMSGVAEKTAECLLKKHPKLKVVFAYSEWPNGNVGRLSHVANDARLAFVDNSSKTRSLSESRLKSLIENSNKDKPTFSSFTSGQTPLIQNTKYKIHNSIDILFVAFGAPKQEFWINKNLDKLPVKVAIGVGGSFDYISGEIKRPAKWIRQIGLEWLFRLITQPWRIKRQTALLEFIWLIIKEKLNKN